MRALIFALMADGQSTIRNYLNSPDTDALLLSMEKLGAKIKKTKDYITVEGVDNASFQDSQVIDCNNSGIALRFLTAISCLQKVKISMTGDESLQNQRPMKPLIEALKKLGAKFTFEKKEYFCPFTITQGIDKSETTVEGSDSQFVSALLLMGAFSENPFTLNVTSPGEIPWVKLTLYWLDKFNIPYKVNKAFTRYRIYPTKKFHGFEYTVPSDLSSAAFPIVGALITNSEITLNHIDLNDPQGDKKLISVLSSMGANFSYDKNKQTLKVHRSPALQGKKIDMNDFIDGICVMAIIGCFAEGKTTLYNASIARTKECNRLSAMETELKKMGANITQTKDGLEIFPSKLKGATLHSYFDHRVILSLSVAALGVDGQTVISPSDPITKTYSTFVEDFKNMSAHIKVL